MPIFHFAFAATMADGDWGSAFAQGYGTAGNRRYLFSLDLERWAFSVGRLLVLSDI
jgi:hypothetical protein